MQRSRLTSLETDSEAQTRRLGNNIGKRVVSDWTIGVTGPLGAGKTTLVRGICAGLGVDDEVLSPTFILYEEFVGRLHVIHVDLYRLEHESEIEELGLFDMPGTGKVLVVEWADRSDRLIGDADIVIHLKHAKADRRGIDIECTAEAAAVLEGVQAG